MKSRAGFTLLEMLIVITIVGILAALGLTNLRRDTPQVRDAARVLMADINRARSEAIRLNTTVGVTFDPGQGSYRAFLMGAGNTAIPNDGSVTGSAYSGVAANGVIFQRVLTAEFPLAVLASTNYSNNTLSFDVRGLPLGFNNGTIILRSRRDTSYGLKVIIAAAGRVRLEAL